MGDKKALIAGQWVESESGKWIDVLDKGTGEVMGRVPSCTPKDVDRAIEAAKEGHKALAALSVRERVDLLYAAFAIGERRQEEMAQAMAMEVGKTLAEAREEVSDYALVDFVSAAERASSASAAPRIPPSRRRPTTSASTSLTSHWA